MGSKYSSISNEDMLASIDPGKMYNMSWDKRLAAQLALDFFLSSSINSRGRIRSKFKGYPIPIARTFSPLYPKVPSFPLQLPSIHIYGFGRRVAVNGERI